MNAAFKANDYLSEGRSKNIVSLIFVNIEKKEYQYFIQISSRNSDFIVQQDLRGLIPKQNLKGFTHSRNLKG